MIDYIKLKNFRSHKRTTLKLHPGINGVVGLPSSGKTNIIRGVLLLKNNRPSGFKYHNKDTKNPETEVIIKPDNSPILKLTKTKSKTIYQCGKEELQKVGKSIPDEVTNNLNLEDINFGLQLGLPYLILSSPPDIARAINKVTESDTISRCIIITNQLLNKLKATKKSLLLDIHNLKEKLLPLKKLDRVKPILDKAFRYHNKVEENQEKIEELKDIQSSIAEAQEAIDNQRNPLRAKVLIKKAELIESKMLGIATQLTLLENIKVLRLSLNSAIIERDKLISNYINELRTSRTCPICYSTINSKTIRSIKKEFKK